MASDRVVASSNLSLCTVLSDDSISIAIQNPVNHNNEHVNEENLEDDQGPGSFVEVIAFSEVTNNALDEYDLDYVSEFEEINSIAHECTGERRTDTDRAAIAPTPSQNTIGNYHCLPVRQSNQDEIISVYDPSISSHSLSFALDSSLSSAPSIGHSRNPTPDELLRSETTIIQEGELNKINYELMVTPRIENKGSINQNLRINDTSVSTVPSIPYSEKPPRLLGSFGTNDSQYTDSETAASLLSSWRWNGRNNRRKNCIGHDDDNTSISSSIVTSALPKVKSKCNFLLGAAVSAVVVAGAIILQALVSNRRSQVKDDDDNQ
jgi:hypothetical protein